MALARPAPTPKLVSPGSALYLMRVSLPNLHSFLFRLGLIAILAAVLCQATPSAPVPIVRDRGSAFDATTVEVAVLAQRDGEARQIAEVKPVPPLTRITQTRIIASAMVRFDNEPPKQTGPPPATIWRVVPPMRAPPIRT